MADDIDGSIGAVAIVPTEVIVDGGKTACFGLDKVGGVGGDFENHIARVVAKDGMGAVAYTHLPLPTKR